MNCVPNCVQAIFNKPKALIGVVHLLPLPGSPQCREGRPAIMAAARKAARTLLDAGFDGLMFENFCDVPFHPESVPPHVVGMVSVLIHEFSNEAPCGANILRNAARDGLAAAFAGGGRYIRVNIHTGAALTDQGIIQGKAWQTLRYRKTLDADVCIFADVQVKHATPIASADPIVEARDCVERGLADALIVTGSRTGEAVDAGLLGTIVKAVPDTPVFIGSGARADNIKDTLSLADGVIVSTSLEERLGVIDPDRAKAFVQAAGDVL